MTDHIRNEIATWADSEYGNCPVSASELLALIDAQATEIKQLRAELAKQATAPDDQLRKDVELLLTNANWNVGGVLSEESRRRDYPSNGVAHVRLRDLARLRDALKGTP